MKMFPRLAIVILFTLLSIQQTRSNCCPQLAKAVNAFKSVFQKKQDRITYKKFEEFKNIPSETISTSGSPRSIVVGEFYSDEIGEVGSQDDHAKCTQMETPEQWPSNNYLPSVRFIVGASNLHELRLKKTMDEKELKRCFDYQKEIWKCETQGKKFNMVVNRLENKFQSLNVREVKYLSGVTVEKKVIAHDKCVAKIKEVKFFNPETHGLVKYAGYVKLIESETNNP